MALIKTENLNYVYSPDTPFEKAAICDINIEINEGEFIGIIGHTGSGKSTLVQHLNGLIRPTSGKIYVDGVDIWQEPKKIRDMRFKVGLVFQYPEYQLFDETVRSDIAFGPKNMGLSEDEINERVLRASDAVGLSRKLLDKSPFDLSGGQKRRAALAGVLAMEPKVLILDEPTAGLDPKGRDTILDRIKEFRKTYNTTVLLVSHSMEDIAKVADRVLVMNKSRVHMFDSVENVFKHSAELSKIGLNVPQITQVFMGLKEKGYPVEDSVYTVDKAFEVLNNILGGNQNA
ncbi:MAG: energy-coupling factor transporter ATPase [Acutalibacteraceae bacterium]|nr:energy-coupling factor transporter ATPase [Acutalibacteraceae bacterium]